MVRPLCFEGQGFVLRPYRPGDGKALNEATRASYDHLKPWMPWASDTQTPGEAEEIIWKLAGNYLLGNDFTIGIFEGETLLGGTGFHLRVGPEVWKCAEIGMWIRADRASTGLGTKVLAAMLEWGFGEWGWERLVWRCDTTNLASARVAEKCGMIREGTMISELVGTDGTRRDSHWYALTAAVYRDLA